MKEKNFKAGWIMVVIYALAVLALGLFAPDSRVYLAMLSLTANIVVSLYLAYHTYGLKNSTVLIGVSFAVAVVLENMSMATGWPYGVFEHFMPGPRIGTVPLVVCFAYFSFCIIGWMYADLMVGDQKQARFLRPVIAAFVGSAMDALYDPIGSLLLHQWQYPNGGGFFGVPFTNSLGWIINITVTMLIFEFLTKPKTDRPSAMHLQATSLLGLQVVPLILGHLLMDSEAVTDCTGKVWQTGDLYETLSILGLLVMGTLVLNGVAAYIRRCSAWSMQSKNTPL